MPSNQRPAEQYDPIRRTRIYDSDAGPMFLGSLSGALVGLDDGLVYYCTEGFELMFGYHVRGDLLGQTIETVVPANKRQEHQIDREMFSKAPHPRPMGNPKGFVEGQRRDGTVFPVAVSLGKAQVVSGVRLVAVIVLELPLKKDT